MENDAGLKEKVETILRLRPDAVHLGVCCCHNGKDRVLCDEVEALGKVFEKNGIPVIRGTHSKF